MRDTSTAAIISHLVERQGAKAERLEDIALFDWVTHAMLTDDDFSDDQILTGYDPGRVGACLSRWDGYGSANQGCILAVDFGEVQSVTATWWEKVWMRVLEESIHWGIYPVAANVPWPAVAELELVARMHHEIFAICQTAPGERPGESARWHSAQLVGNIEGRERWVLERLLQSPGISAPDLHARQKADGGPATQSRSMLPVGSSAISNVLAVLYKRRLVYEVQAGRRKRFFPLLPWSLKWDQSTHPRAAGCLFYITEIPSE